MFSKIALVTTIENNIDNKNSKFLGIERKYFDEALKCFESWEKFHPEIKKYTICPTKATLNESEIEQLKEINVTYIEKYFPESEEYENGFINVDLSTAYLEEILEEDIFIHTDLDMTLLKKLPDSLFKGLDMGKIKCGMYDAESRKSQRVDYDTGFTISLRKSRFYDFYWKVVKQILEGIIKLPEGVTYYDIEEYAMGLIESDTYWNIIPLLKYQVGEGYPSVDFFTDLELEGIYFWHEHLVNDKKENLIKEKIKLFKRVKDLKNRK